MAMSVEQYMGILVHDDECRTEYSHRLAQTIMR